MKMKTELNILDILVTTFHWIVSVDLHDAGERDHKRGNCKGGLQLMSLEQVIWRLDYILCGLYSFIEKMYISEKLFAASVI